MLQCMKCKLWTPSLPPKLDLPDYSENTPLLCCPDPPSSLSRQSHRRISLLFMHASGSCSTSWLMQLPMAYVHKDPRNIQSFDPPVYLLDVERPVSISPCCTRMNVGHAVDNVLCIQDDTASYEVCMGVVQVIRTARALQRLNAVRLLHFKRMMSANNESTYVCSA